MVDDVMDNSIKETKNDRGVENVFVNKEIVDMPSNLILKANNYNNNLQKQYNSNSFERPKNVKGGDKGGRNMRFLGDADTNIASCATFNTNSINHSNNQSLMKNAEFLKLSVWQKVYGNKDNTHLNEAHFTHTRHKESSDDSTASFSSDDNQAQNSENKLQRSFKQTASKDATFCTSGASVLTQINERKATGEGLLAWSERKTCGASSCVLQSSGLKILINDSTNIDSRSTIGVNPTALPTTPMAFFTHSQPSSTTSTIFTNYTSLAPISTLPQASDSCDNVSKERVCSDKMMIVQSSGDYNQIEFCHIVPKGNISISGAASYNDNMTASVDKASVQDAATIITNNSIPAADKEKISRNTDTEASPQPSKTTLCTKQKTPNSMLTSSLLTTTL